MADPEKVMRELVEECLRFSDRAERTGKKRLIRKAMETCKGAKLIATALGRPGFAGLSLRRMNRMRLLRTEVNGG